MPVICKNCGKEIKHNGLHVYTGVPNICFVLDDFTSPPEKLKQPEKLKHDIANTNDLMIVCSRCGKRKTMQQDLVDCLDGKPSFAEEECNSNESPSVKLKRYLQEPTKTPGENELQAAFDDLMKEFSTK